MRWRLSSSIGEIISSTGLPASAPQPEYGSRGRLMANWSAVVVLIVFHGDPQHLHHVLHGVFPEEASEEADVQGGLGGGSLTIPWLTSMTLTSMGAGQRFRVGPFQQWSPLRRYPAAP